MASDNETPITGDQMDVLDRLWSIFYSVSIKWQVLADRAGFNTPQDAERHYSYIGKSKPQPRRDYDHPPRP
ncbi:hypothetical protein PG993_008384 [Apiospora rasikravindrae]|uniref:Uncharacterized protein n=1 Tax=Apiospora rasikravindrae TaxID=990691 RepID=A0ABR1T066_9PEZI